MLFSVVASSSASKEFDRLPMQVQRRFSAAFGHLAENPRHSDLDIRPLHGRDHWRLRIGAYRGIDEIRGKTIRFLRFGHRSKVYR